MRCPDEATLRAYVDDEVDPAVPPLLAAHLQACRNCRARTEELTGQRERVGNLLALLEPRGEYASPEDALGAFRTRVSGSSQPRHLPVLRIALATGAFALAVVAAVTGVRYVRPAPQQEQPANQPAARQASARPPSVAPIASDAAVVPRPAEPRAPADPRIHRAIRRVTPAARPAPFILLSDQVVSPDVGIVVRMKVPISIFASTEIGAPSGPLSREVDADVLVGQDGRACAVRLVSSSTEQRGRK